VVSCRFRYEPISASSAKGSVMLGFNYDARDDLFGTAIEFLESSGSVQDRVWVPITMNLNAGFCNNNQNHYVRTSVQPSNTDIRLYDVGVFQIATDGCADTSTIGNIYIDYSIDVIKPKHHVNGFGYMAYGVTGIDTTHPLGTVVIEDSNNNLPCSFSNRTLVLPYIGSYLVTYHSIATTHTGLPNLTAGTNQTIASMPMQTEAMGASASTANVCSLGLVITSDVYTNLDIVDSTTVTTPTGAIIFVSLMPSFDLVSLFAKPTRKELEEKQRQRQKDVKSSVDKEKLLIDDLVGLGKLTLEKQTSPQHIEGDYKFVSSSGRKRKRIIIEQEDDDELDQKSEIKGGPNPTPNSASGKKDQGSSTSVRTKSTG